MHPALRLPEADEVKSYLDVEIVLRATVEQLRKDLALGDAELVFPKVGEGAFEELRTQVMRHLEDGLRAGPTFLARAINRVDLTERMVAQALDTGGMPQLAGLLIQRCLLKVLLREYFARRNGGDGFSGR